MMEATESVKVMTSTLIVLPWVITFAQWVGFIVLAAIFLRGLIASVMDIKAYRPKKK